MKAKNDLFGKVTGFAVFILGIAMLVSVGGVAYGFFKSPNGGLDFATSKDLGRSAILLVIKILMLLVITAIGSLTATKGVQLYHASTAPADSEPDK